MAWTGDTNMRHRFRWALAANAALILTAALYSGGALIMIGIMPALHILLFMLNCQAAVTRKQIILLGMTHITVTFATQMLWSRLYFAFICDDYAGRAIAAGLCLIGVVWTTILLLAMLVRFRMIQKHEVH